MQKILMRICILYMFYKINYLSFKSKKSKEVSLERLFQFYNLKNALEINKE